MRAYVYRCAKCQALGFVRGRKAKRGTTHGPRCGGVLVFEKEQINVIMPAEKESTE